LPSLLVVSALLGAAAAPALAQTATPVVPVPSTQTRGLAPGAAAATLPNSFDRPVTRAAPVAAPPVAAPTAAQVTEVQIAEGMLRTVIADLAEGELDAELFTPSLAGRLTPQLPQLQPVVQGFGALGPVEPQGATNGANQFLVTFENAVTQWVIGLDADGLISALLFRPAPPASSEPEADDVAAEPPVAATSDATPSDDDR
jgi:hypothetical protein